MFYNTLFHVKETTTVSAAALMMMTTRKYSPRPRPTATHRTLHHETATRRGPKDESRRGEKRKAQSEPEPVRGRLRTDPVMLCNGLSCDTEQQPPVETTERTKSALVSISRGESILNR